MRRRTYRLDWPILLVAACVVIPLYWPSLRFDLFQDDYFLLRPWSPDHLTSVVTGPWFGPGTGNLYRPFAIYFFKAIFFTFGLNTRALHLLPFVTMTVLAWLIGRFVRRETGSLPLGATAAFVYAIHPATATAIGPWIANQYQGVVSGMVLVSLLWWQYCRQRQWPVWVPLLVPIIIGGFTKETGLMIPLILAALHGVRARWLGDIGPVRRWPIAAGLAVFGSLIAWRAVMLGTLGLSELPPGDVILSQLVEGPYAVLFEPSRLTASWGKYVFAATALVLVAAAFRSLVTRAPKGVAALALTGTVVLAAAAFPTSVVFSRDRLAPHDVGAVLILTAGLAAIAPRVRAALRLPTLAAVVVVLVATAGMTRDAIWRFHPCNSDTVQHPEGLLDEVRQPPPEMLHWLHTLPKPCAAATHVPFFRATSRITWGVAERLAAPGDVIQAWITPRVVALLDRRGTGVTVEIRHPGASPEFPVRIRVWTNEGEQPDVVLTSPAWRAVRLALAPTFLTWLRQMHRLELRSSPEFVPGLEMRPLDVVY